MQPLQALASELGQALIKHRRQLVLAESCTGGWVSKACTDVPGSSVWLDSAIVSYSNSAKQRLLNVPAQVLETNGAVSEATALAMVKGAVRQEPARVGIAITGVAGPSGGTVENPIGLVWFAWALGEDWIDAESMRFSGGRDEVRYQSVEFALQGALSRLLNTTIR